MSEFKKGDVVTGETTRPVQTVSGTITGFHTWYFDEEPFAAASVDVLPAYSEYGSRRSVRVSSLRRAGQPAEGKFYGSQPAVLPRTLPAGTKSLDGHELKKEAKLQGAYYSVSDDCSWTPQYVDWSTVPIQPSPASSLPPVICGDCGDPIANPLEACKRTRRNSAGLNEYLPGSFHATCQSKPAPAPNARSARHCDKCMNPAAAGEDLCNEHLGKLAAQPEAGRPDPYRTATIAQCMHRNADLMRGFCGDCGASSMQARVADRPINFLKWSDEQDHLAEKRTKHRDGILSDLGGTGLDRPMLKRAAHPAAWPEDCDSEELRVT